MRYPLFYIATAPWPHLGILPEDTIQYTPVATPEIVLTRRYPARLLPTFLTLLSLGAAGGQWCRVARQRHEAHQVWVGDTIVHDPEESTDIMLVRVLPPNHGALLLAIEEGVLTRVSWSLSPASPLPGGSSRRSPGSLAADPPAPRLLRVK